MDLKTYDIYRAIRKKKGIKLKLLAELLGISISSISLYESGKIGLKKADEYKRIIDNW
jgi:transcriptional regulator with XRE-family HTH domain